MLIKATYRRRAKSKGASLPSSILNGSAPIQMKSPFLDLCDRRSIFEPNSEIRCKKQRINKRDQKQNKVLDRNWPSHRDRQ